jgi:hypothetical protein
VDAVPALSIKHTAVRHQPGDGHCLYHSLSFGTTRNANQLRSQIALFQQQNPEALRFGTKCTYRQTAFDERSKDLKSYCQEMANSRLLLYGGTFEIDAYSKMESVRVIVYKRERQIFKPWALYEPAGEARGVQHLLYSSAGDGHYDVLELNCAGKVAAEKKFKADEKKADKKAEAMKKF